MKFRGIFCGTTATTNEEYRKVLKNRNLWMIGLTIIGLMIAVVALWAEKTGATALPDYIIGVYCGFGTGLAIAGVILFVRNLLLMKNEEKLKESRLENSDERLTEIRNKALQAAVKILLLVGVAASMILGIFEPVLIKACLFLLYVFLFSFIIATAYYKKRM